MANDCSPIMDELDRLLVQRETFDWGNRPPGSGNPRFRAWQALQTRITDAQRRLRACINAPPANPPAVPVKLSVSGIQCFDQNDGPGLIPFDTEDDEPYVLVWAINIPSLFVSLNPPRLVVNPPRPKVVTVGPWDDVDDDEQIYQAPANTIWDRNSGLIRTPNDVVFVAALVENDNSDPQAVSAVVEAQMFAQLVASLPSLVTNRTTFASGMVDAMTRAVAFATTPLGSGGVLDADDRIDLAKELRLNQADLDRAFSGRSIRRMLPFQDGSADYRVFFDLARA
jgi:hypothetical protein